MSPSGAPARELSGERASRIVDAMRSSVAARGIAGATFEHVASEAGVSRGLLHYYFGTKEQLLVEVVRRDSEIRVARLDEPLAAASTADQVLDVLVSSLLDLVENDPGFFVLLFELFTAGRRHPEIQRGVAEMFRKTRARVATALEGKDHEGVISLRFGAEATVGFLFSIADGFAVQAIWDPDVDHARALAAGREAARHLLEADPAA